MENGVTFIDETVTGIARPERNAMLQQVAYYGHKQNHALKYHVVTTPDGICIHLHGPGVGRRHDKLLHASSGMDEILSPTLHINDKQYVVFGNSVCTIEYIWRCYLAKKTWIKPIRNFAQPCPRFAYQCNGTFWRSNVFWGLPKAKCKLHTRQKLAGLIYQDDVLLTNVHSCIRPNSISQYFVVQPPSMLYYVG